jgi:hypothetical protein
MLQARFWGLSVRHYPSIFAFSLLMTQVLKSRFASPAFKRAMDIQDLAILRRMTNPPKPDASRIIEPGIGTAAGVWVTEEVSMRGYPMHEPI